MRRPSRHALNKFFFYQGGRSQGKRSIYHITIMLNKKPEYSPELFRRTFPLITKFNISIWSRIESTSDENVHKLIHAGGGATANTRALLPGGLPPPQVEYPPANCLVNCYHLFRDSVPTKFKRT